MSGGICAVPECRNCKRQINSKSFFRFPKNKEICRQWVVFSKRTDLEHIFNKDGPERLYRSYNVCSDHFLKTDFRNKNLFSQGIWPGSVPSVMLPGQETPKEETEEELKPVEFVKIEEAVEHLPVSEDLSEDGGDTISKTTEGCKHCLDVKLKVKRLQRTLYRYKKVNTALRTQIKELKEKLVNCESANKNYDKSVKGDFMVRQATLNNSKLQGQRYSHLIRTLL